MTDEEQGIHETPEYLEMFLRNLLLDEKVNEGADSVLDGS
jgi:hypothetical protein